MLGFKGYRAIGLSIFAFISIGFLDTQSMNPTFAADKFAADKSEIIRDVAPSEGKKLIPDQPVDQAQQSVPKQAQSDSPQDKQGEVQSNKQPKQSSLQGMKSKQNNKKTPNTSSSEPIWMILGGVAALVGAIIFWRSRSK